MEGVLVRKESKNYLQSNPISRFSMMVLFYVDNVAAWHRSCESTIRGGHGSVYISKVSHFTFVWLVSKNLGHG